MMGLFSRKKTEYPKMPEGDYEPVLRCSICTGEQVLCARDRKTGNLLELMLIRNPSQLEGFCSQNGFDPDSITRIY
jgi:hypothetical protein